MPRHEGREKDSWQVPHRNRRRVLVKFWFSLSPPSFFASIVGVPEPLLPNLQKYKKEVLEANDSWTYYVKHPVTGMPEKRCRVVKVTADILGADV